MCAPHEEVSLYVDEDDKSSEGNANARYSIFPVMKNFRHLNILFLNVTV